MKNYYKISEISKLYDIGVDSLRYYERLGILTPRRDTNGYRLYNLTDLYKLNLIRDLRALDFSMSQIKDYLDEQSAQNTLDLLYQEQALVDQELERLTIKKRIISDRIHALSKSQEIKTGLVEIKTFPTRYCVRLNEHITRDEEMDLLIKKLHQKHEDKIRDLGNLTIGAFLSMPEIHQGIANVYSSVFFVLEKETSDYDFCLSEGKYLSCFYRGTYEQNADRSLELLDYAAKHGLQTTNEPFEFYTIDNRDTIQTSEFLTEIQVQLI